MYDIKFNLPNLAKGAEFDIGGLGRFENGKSYVIDDETADYFRQYNGYHATVEPESEQDVEPQYEFTPGPALLEAFKDVEGIDVSVHKKEKAPVSAPNAGGNE